MFVSARGWIWSVAGRLRGRLASVDSKGGGIACLGRACAVRWHEVVFSRWVFILALSLCACVYVECV